MKFDCESETMVAAANTMISRRAFALGCASCIVVPALSACENHQDTSSVDEDPVQYGFLLRIDRCIGCASCVAACRDTSGTPDGAPSRRHVLLYSFADGTERHISYSCMHCAEPACVAVCPAGAISKGTGGVVLVNRERCIGCKFCHQACPFQIPGYTSEGMDKCDCCTGAGVKLGDAPACVSTCPTRALGFGKMETLLEVPGARMIDAPGKPSFATS